MGRGEERPLPLGVVVVAVVVGRDLVPPACLRDLELNQEGVEMGCATSHDMVYYRSDGCERESRL